MPIIPLIALTIVCAILLGSIGYFAAAEVTATIIGRTGTPGEGNGHVVLGYGLLGMAVGAVAGVALSLTILA
jgi:hypothetical protein